MAHKRHGAAMRGVQAFYDETGLLCEDDNGF